MYKKSLLCCLLIFLSIVARSQVNYSGNVLANVGVSSDQFICIGAITEHGFSHHNVFLGVGTGVSDFTSGDDVIEKITVPLFCSFKYYLMNNGRLKPYVSIRDGICFDVNEDERQISKLYDISIGVELSNKLLVQASSSLQRFRYNEICDFRVGIGCCF